MDKNMQQKTFTSAQPLNYESAGLELSLSFYLEQVLGLS